MAKVELKQPVVAEIAEVLNGAKSAVVVDYRGLTVEQDTALRKQLREAGVSYKVYKNTMIRFAAKGTEFEALEPHLEGPTALAVSKEDATAPARVLAEFAKKADKLELKGGVVEGTYYDAAGIGVIAAAGVVVAAAGAGAAAEEEKTEFDVELTEVGPNKVKVIKVVREVTGLGLKEAKDVVDGAPKVLKQGASKDEANDIKTKLEAEGAKITLK